MLKADRDWENVERLYGDSISGRYNRDYHHSPLMMWQAENFALYVQQSFHRNDRVLDLGCGPASLWRLWEEKLAGAGTLVGVDLSEGMIAEARRSFPQGLFNVGSFFEIPAKSGYFDIVIVSSAFHHIPDKALPDALKEIHRVLDEHGVLIGREPLGTGRISERGSWFSGALMHLRHLAYRLTHTREYPEQAPGPEHHAYEAQAFLKLIESCFMPTKVEFRHPASPFLGRTLDPVVVEIAKMLDDMAEHREGQEIYYTAHKNYSTHEDVKKCVRMAIKENKIKNVNEFLSLVEAASLYLEQRFGENKDKE